MKARHDVEGRVAQRIVGTIKVVCGTYLYIEWLDERANWLNGADVEYVGVQDVGPPPAVSTGATDQAEAHEERPERVTYCHVDPADGRLNPMYFCARTSKTTWERPDSVSLDRAKAEYKEALERWAIANPGIAEEVMGKGVSEDFDYGRQGESR